MRILEVVSSGIDSVNRWVGNCVAWVTGILVLTVFTDVLLRYFFNISYVAMREMEWHLFSFIFLIGAGYTLLEDSHVRVDVFYQRFSKKMKALVNLLGVLFLLFPGCYLIITTSYRFSYKAYAILERSPDPGGLPFRFILKGCISLGFIFVLLQGISIVCKSILTLSCEKTEAERTQ